jgi:hypothetical protein
VAGGLAKNAAELDVRLDVGVFGFWLSSLRMFSFSPGVEGL